MKKFIFIILTIIFLAPNVYAAEYNMNSKTSATKDGTKNRYRGVEIYQTGMPGTWTFGTRYTGKLSTIETYFDYPFEANTTYTLTYNMNTEDFRNNFAAKYWWDCEHDDMNALNQHVGSFTYVSYKKVKFSFTPEENTTCIRVLIGSSNQSSQAITGISNWRLDSITLYDPDYQSGSGSGQGSSPSPTPSSDPNQSIINNQNNNTQDIINNQNNNTQDVIDNNNENTDKIIENQNSLLGNMCPNIFGNYTIIKAWMNETLLRVDPNTGNRTAIIGVDPNTTYTISREYLTSSFRVSSYPTKIEQGSSVVDYTIPRAVQNNDGKVITYTTGPNDYYMYIHYGNTSFESQFVIDKSFDTLQVEVGTNPTSYCKFGTFKSKLDDTTDAINNLNDTMKDDNVDDKGSFFTDFEDNDHGLSSIITLPLSTIQSLTSKTCVSLSVPIPFTNQSVSLPCMSEVYQTYIPSIYSIWQVVSFGIIAYFICLDIYKMVKGFKDPNEDKVEVLDL